MKKLGRISTRKQKLAVFIAIFAVLGLVITLIIRAAPPFVSLETESSSLANGAVTGSDNNASNNAFVRFGGQVSAGKPTAATTGVPAGTSLTVVNGNQNYTTPGQVISGLDIHGFVEIRAANVTIRDSIIRGGNRACGSNTAALWVRDDYGASATIEDTEIVPSFPTPCMDGAWAVRTTFRRVNVHNAVDGIKAHNNVTIENSYIHDLTYFSGGGGTHNDGVQTYTCNSNILIKGNNIDLSTSQNGNAAYQITQDNGVACNNIVIDGNWLDGGGCTLNIAHKSLANMNGKVTVTNNRFGRNRAFNGCLILLSTQTTLAANSGNVYDDTGQPIPPPHVHD